jgi:predicted  nucleic acid-binding Zn-ribbon protein
MTNEDKIEIQRITDEIERKQAEYDADENVRRDLLDDIDDLEEERDELERKIDVYDIVPIDGTYYQLTNFIVLNSPDLEGRVYAVGDEEEIDDAARENIEQLIDDIGYEGFRPGFVRDYIDEEAVMDYARDFYDDDVNNNPEVYLDENDRQLSDSQEEQIRILKRKISQISSLIEQLEDQINDENDDIEEQIDELNDNITDIESEIEDIEGEPDGDWPSHLVEEKVDELVDNVDIEDFMNEFGLDVNDYIDKDKFIKGVIDADGYGSINSYDGNVDEVTVLKILFYIMRIE